MIEHGTFDGKTPFPARWSWGPFGDVDIMAEDAAAAQAQVDAINARIADAWVLPLERRQPMTISLISD